MLRSAIRLLLSDEGQLGEQDVINAKVLLQVGDAVEELAVALGSLSVQQALDNLGLVLR